MLKLHFALGLTACVLATAALLQSGRPDEALQFAWLGAMVLTVLAGLVLGIQGLRGVYRPGVVVGFIAPVVAGALLWFAIVSDEWYGFDYSRLIAWTSAALLPAIDAVLLLPRPAPSPAWLGPFETGRRQVRRLRTLVKIHLAGSVLVAVFVLHILSDPGGDAYLPEWIALTAALALLGAAIGWLGWRARYRQAQWVGALAVLPASVAVLVVGLDGWFGDVIARWWDISEWDVSAVVVILFLAAHAVMLLVDLWFIASAPKRFGGDAAGPPPEATCGELPTSTVAEAIRDTLASHDPVRLRHRLLRPLVEWGWITAPVTLGFLGLAVNAQFDLGLEHWEHHLGFWFLVGIGVVVWIASIDPVKDFIHNALGTHTGSAAETALIEVLEAGRPFGLYLRAFDERGPARAVIRAIVAFKGCPCFALVDVRSPNPGHRMPEIWVPDRHWQRIALPLIDQAAFLVFDLSNPGGVRSGTGNPGLTEELAHAVDKGLTRKAVLITPAPGARWERDSRSGTWGMRNFSSIEDCWGQRIAALTQPFSNRLPIREIGDLPGRLAAFVSVERGHA